MTTITKSDPRLTAFVLGELSADEAQEIQTAIASDAELQQEIEAIRQTVAEIETAMREEPLPKRAAGASPPVPNEESLLAGQPGGLRPPLLRRLLFPAAITAIAASLLVAVLIAYQQEWQIARHEPMKSSALEVPEATAQLDAADEWGYRSYDSNAIGRRQQAEPVIAPKTELAKELVEAEFSFSPVPADSLATGMRAMNSGQVPQEQAPQQAAMMRQGFTPASEPAPPATAMDPKPLSFPMETAGADPLASQQEQAQPAYNASGYPGGGMMGGGMSASGGMRGGMGGGMMGSGGGIDDANSAPAVAQAGRGRLAGGFTPDSIARQPAQAVPGTRPQITTSPLPGYSSQGFSSQPATPIVEDMPAIIDVMPAQARRMAQLSDRQQVLLDSYNRERNEAYKDFTENDFQAVKVGEFSTFSVDVDTAAYTLMRLYVNDRGMRPPTDSVRLEEYINFFKYDYAQPDSGVPFATHVDVSSCPWNPKHLLARIGIKGKEYTVDERPALNLVFLIDVSGSMESANRLPLVKRGLTELVEMLQPKDRVAIVTYAGDSRLVLPSVSGQEKRAILDSVDALTAGGSTNGAGGIRMAYETARKYFDQEAQNRVILCTDGDFNVGPTNNMTLEQMIKEEAKSGVFLTVLGFGMGNLKDDRLKTLSMAGNGNYGYIDSIEECQRLLVHGLSSTLFTIAKDVKIQVDFNPAHVSGYRLLGYENRKLRDEDFHNDAVDAGDIGAGHTVTALYEIVPVGVNLPSAVDRSRYDTSAQPEPAGLRPPLLEFADELMFVKLRYKAPDGDKGELLEYPVKNEVREANVDSQFASAVALYGMLLRSSRHSGTGSWDTILELAVPNTKEDKYREEFVELVKKAKELR